MFGFHGKYLRFDLSKNQGEKVSIPEKILRRYLGGVGLGAWILHRENPIGIHPLDPRSALVFSFSPLAGTSITTSAKFSVVAKSPLTGFLCDAMSSSNFAISGKRMGVDALVFVGKCTDHSVWLHGTLVGTDMWGAPNSDVLSKYGPYGDVASIGRAGENKVRFATLSNDGRHAGRGGLGAVMGSKNLKAIVVAGDVPTKTKDRKTLDRIARDLRRRSLGPATVKYREVGTISNLSAFNRLGILPTRNFQQGKFSGADKLSAESLITQRSEGRTACMSCSIGCEHRFSRKSGEKVRLEYETLFALGPLCGISDPETVLEAATLCDTLGLDTISTGVTIAFAMECNQRGLLSSGPRFGNSEDLCRLVGDIAELRGLGARLARGSYNFSTSLGKATLSFAPHVKGLELPGYEPRALHSMALGLAVGTRGADHNRSSAYEVDFSGRANRYHGGRVNAEEAATSEERSALLDSIILCKFLRGAFDNLEDETAKILSALTGWDITSSELVTSAKRIISLKKSFNIREGWLPEDDTLPLRFLTETLEGETPASLTKETLTEMIRQYNNFRGWETNGYLKKNDYIDLAKDGVVVNFDQLANARKERENFLLNEN